MNEQVEKMTVEELTEKVHAQDECLCRVAETLDDVLHLLSSLADGELDRAELREVTQSTSNLCADLGGKP